MASDEVIDARLERKVAAGTAEAARRREIGNFGAHTQTDEQDGTIINASAEEAEWTLDVLDRLFDHFILSPAADEKIRKAMDAKLDASGRRPIALPPDDDDGS